FDAQLTGLASSNPLHDMLRKFDPNPDDPQELHLSLSLQLQRAAIAGLGTDLGAVVMLDPKTGEILAMASTPTFDAGAVADPTTVSQVTNGGGSFGGGFKDDVELANAAYGQAETLVTPLQMAVVAATIANDGVLMKPRLVTSMTSAKSGTHAVGPEELRRVVD